jgi:hypothetical protein
MLLMVNTSQVYSWPMTIGVLHPFAKPMPCSGAACEVSARRNSTPDAAHNTAATTAKMNIGLDMSAPRIVGTADARHPHRSNTT